MKYVSILTVYHTPSAVYMFSAVCVPFVLCRVLTHSVYCLSTGCYILYMLSVVVMCAFVYCVVY